MVLSQGPMGGTLGFIDDFCHRLWSRGGGKVRVLVCPGLGVLLARSEGRGCFAASPGQPSAPSQQALALVYLLCVCLPVCVSAGQGSQGPRDTSLRKCCGRTLMGSPWTCGPAVSPGKGPRSPAARAAGAISPPSHHSPPPVLLLSRVEVPPGCLPRGHPVHPAGWVSPVLG